MADLRTVELDDLANRPGTYLNPQTEMVIIVDDSASIDAEMFDLGDAGDAEWVHISDEVPVDDHRRDEVLESFQARLHDPLGEDDEDEPEEELEPDPDPEDE